MKQNTPGIIKSREKIAKRQMKEREKFTEGGGEEIKR